MGMTNIFGSQNSFMAAGPQFDMDPSTLKTVTYAFTGAGEETVYTVPAGSTLYISKIILMNLDANSQLFYFEIGGEKIIYREIGTTTNSTVELDFPIPIGCASGTVLTARGSFATNRVAIVGWEV